MDKRNANLTIVLVISLWVFACAHVNYVGNSYESTDHVDVFFSKEDIEKEYTVIGHAVGGGQLFVSTGKLQRKLIEKGQSIGADAVLITGIDRDIESNDEAGFDAEKQVKATFLKYKNPDADQPGEATQKGTM